MRVLGIDCGSERTGFGVVESDGRKHRLVVSGVIRTSPKDAFAHRIGIIGRELRKILQEHQPEEAAVEEVFHAANTKTAIKLAHVRGAVFFVLGETGLHVGEYSALTVKSNVVGYGRAEKQQVQMMLRSMLGQETVFETEDASDALAVAICHATHRITELRMAGAAMGAHR
jgi:crossover junction endodeoxyribonuclease RuvC